MRAARVQSFGPPEAVVVQSLPTPKPGPGEIVAKVAAAGVNFADVLMVAGRYQVKPQLPFTPGLEFAGTVTAVGEGVTRFAIGDRVMGAPPAGGCFAEAIAIAERAVFHAGDLPFPLAAQFLIGHGTAAFALRRCALQPGESVLITGAGGGVGVAAVGIAKRMGATVIAAASKAKLAAAARHGADVLIDYGAQDLRGAIKAATGGKGVDVVLDTVGGATFDAALKSTARWGRLAIVGFAGGEIPRIAAEYLLIKNLTAIGVGFGGALIEDPAKAQEVVDALMILHAARPFEAEVGGTYRLEETGLALRRLADRGVAGKLIVSPAG